MAQTQEWAAKITAEVEKVFLGKPQVVEHMLVALLLGGHILLEDLPGTGKTILARALSTSMGGRFSRIQGTPDLLPTDVLGVSIYNPQEGNFRFRRGPILSHVVLVDEINRATPRTQSALLEAMAEGQISVDGHTLTLPKPFFLIATENPIDFEGTFPLPEAQKDRFLMTLSLGYPHRDIEKEVVLRQRRTGHPIEDLAPVTSPEEVADIQGILHHVYMDPSILDYIVTLVESSRNHPSIRIGVSPRGTLALSKAAQALAALRGRHYVIPDDVKELVQPVFLQRIIVKPESQIRGTTPEQLITELIEATEVPLVSEPKEG
ncbi:ATPase AAA [Spirochaeta lutea]|uniref:ATPase AAA n=1 Tax=Spirochaeta lutea TaxID=1480694 RepID=A0A098QVS7_9SPIO|nr:ATPase AAA [Spirochaeta lutea]